MSDRVVGVVHRWTEGATYGFIRANGRGRVYFTHCGWVEHGHRLAPGDLVEFTPDATDARGPQARDVRRLDACCPKCSRMLHALECACGFQLGA